MITFNY